MSIFKRKRKLTIFAYNTDEYDNFIAKYPIGKEILYLKVPCVIAEIGTDVSNESNDTFIQKLVQQITSITLWNILKSGEVQVLKVDYRKFIDVMKYN